MSASRDEFPKAFAAGKLTEYQYEKFTPRIWTPIFSLFGITPKPGSFLLQYYCLIVEYSPETASRQRRKKSSTTL